MRFSVEGRARGGNRGGRFGLRAMGFHAGGDDEDLPGHQLAEHRDLRLRGHASHLHRHGQRPAQVGHQALGPRHAAPGVPVPKQERVDLSGG